MNALTNGSLIGSKELTAPPCTDDMLLLRSIVHRGGRIHIHDATQWERVGLKSLSDKGYLQRRVDGRVTLARVTSEGVAASGVIEQLTDDERKTMKLLDCDAAYLRCDDADYPTAMELRRLGVFAETVDRGVPFFRLTLVGRLLIGKEDNGDY